MRVLGIHASAKQLAKLKSGGSVRIKRGTGFNLIVSPHTYDRISRTFSSDKSAQIALSPEELEANAVHSSPEAHQQIKDEMKTVGLDAGPIAGQGIFGKKFDRWTKRHGLKKVVDTFGKVAKPVAKQLLDKGLKAAAVAASAMAPEFAPAIQAGARSLNKLGSDYMDRPQYYQDNPSRIGTTLVQGAMGGGIHGPKYLHDAGLGYHQDSHRAAAMDALHIKGRHSMQPYQTYWDDVGGPHSRGIGGGFHIPRPFGLGLGNGHHHEMSSVGRHGGFIGEHHHMPPALMSQPYSANFQFQHFLPPSYQESFMSGQGLYA